MDFMAQWHTPSPLEPLAMAIDINDDRHRWPMVSFNGLHWHNFVAMCLPQSPIKANGVNDVIGFMAPIETLASMAPINRCGRHIAIKWCNLCQWHHRCQWNHWCQWRRWCQWIAAEDTLLLNGAIGANNAIGANGANVTTMFSLLPSVSFTPLASLSSHHWHHFHNSWHHFCYWNHFLH